MKEADDLIYSLLPVEKKGAAIELVPYFLDSFGNATRIDYGSGNDHLKIHRPFHGFQSLSLQVYEHTK